MNLKDINQFAGDVACGVVYSFNFSFTTPLLAPVINK